MITIAGGILLAVLFLALLPYLVSAVGWLIETARRIGMSHRTLARKLSSQGLTFSKISEELKANLAKHYLKNGDPPISQVAWLLGYREISAFTHAFKRWTGLTPRQLRVHGNLITVEGIKKHGGAPAADSGCTFPRDQRGA